MSIHYPSVPTSSSSYGTLRSEPLLSPPRSHDSSEAIPFKADAADLISLTMKKGKVPRHGWHDPFSSSFQPVYRTATTRLTREGPSVWRRSGTCTSPTLRKTISLPVVQSCRFSYNPERQPRSILRSRRWTIPSKSASTRALATIAPIPETTGRVSKKFKTTQTPAMITLRRATTTGSQKRMSLTYFPTPRFSRRNTGFLSSFFTAFSNQGEHHFSPSEILQVMGSRADTTPPPSINKYEARLATSSVAPPIFTELTPIPAQLPLPGQDMETSNSMRRCSTKYVSDDVVYEIIWDEDASDSSSGGCIPSPADREPGVAGEVSVNTRTLERRLSKVLTRSRKSSVLHTNRRTSWWPDSETFPKGLLPLWESPKLAKIAREAAFRNLPRSKSSKKPATSAPLANEIDARQQLLVDDSTTQVGTMFPPLDDGRNNTDPLLSLVDEPNSVPRFSQSPILSAMGDEGSMLTRPRSRLGSKVGVSSHQKRPQALTETILSIGERRFSSAWEGFGRRKYQLQERRSSDDAKPLLGTL
ncbi:hypothetical protein RBB50_006810 [Rhinocladiella similis]